MIWLLLLTALVAGMLLPVQVGINAELRNFVGHPILAATVQFVVGAVALIAIFIAMGISCLTSVRFLRRRGGFGWAGCAGRTTSW